MQRLFEKFQSKLASTTTTFVRSAFNLLDQDSPLIGIKGQRGVGKTTLLLQYAKLNGRGQGQQLYVSLDDLWFSDNKLIDLAEMFYKRGGELLLLDEIHKYPNWAQELKNIYDDFPALKVIFTGSSMLEILNARADLSRRAVVFYLKGLSFREYLELKYHQKFSPCTLAQIIENHIPISQEIVRKTKPLQYFQEYLKNGYYPFFMQSESLFDHKLDEVVNMILEIELPLLKRIDLSYVKKLKQILWILAETVPFVPNMSKLSERIGINRKTLLLYIQYLRDAGLLKHIYKNAKGITALQKPDKILLDNTNLSYMLSNVINIGTVRETFFVNQLSAIHLVEYAEKGDFLVNRLLTFEIGGKHKNTKQIKKVDNSFIAADDIEFGYENKIPLWLFGFLY